MRVRTSPTRAITLYVGDGTHNAWHAVRRAEFDPPIIGPALCGRRPPVSGWQAVTGNAEAGICRECDRRLEGIPTAALTPTSDRTTAAPSAW